MQITQRFRIISDDDICSDCANCLCFRSSDESVCLAGWPGHSNRDGYIISCDERITYKQFLPKEN